MLKHKIMLATLIGLIVVKLDSASAQPDNRKQADFDGQADALDKKAMDYIKSQPNKENQEALMKVWRSTQNAFGGTPLVRQVRNQADSEESLADAAFQVSDYQNAQKHYMQFLAYFEAKCKTGAFTESKSAVRSVTSINDCLDCLKSIVHLYGVDAKSNICCDAVIKVAQNLFYLGFIEDHLGNYSQADRLYIGAFPYVIVGTYPGIPPGQLGGVKIENQLKWSLTQVESKCVAKSPSTAIRAELLADFYCHGGNYSEAERLYNQAIAIRKGLRETDSPYFLSHDLSNLSLCLSRQHKDSSDISSQLALEKEHAYGKDSLEAAYAWYGAGNRAMAKRDYKTALPYLERAIPIFEKQDLKTWPRKNMDLPGYKGQLDTCRWMLKKAANKNEFSKISFNPSLIYPEKVWIVYRNKLLEKILSNHPPTKISPPVSIPFRLHNDGNISGAYILRSCGNKKIDQQALQAVQHSTPFERLPAEQGEYQDATLECADCVQLIFNARANRSRIKTGSFHGGQTSQ